VLFVSSMNFQFWSAVNISAGSENTIFKLLSLMNASIQGYLTHTGADINVVFLLLYRMHSENFAVAAAI
jgi:hypothetical protein